MKVDAIGTVGTFEDTGIDPAPVDAGAAWDASGHVNIPEPETTESLSERANRSVEQMRKEFAEIRKQGNEWRDNVIRLNVAQADNAVPDDEVKVNELAKQFNAPPEMVRNYRKLFEAQARNLKLAELQKTNPKTADFLIDPNNARIAHDDIDNLARTEDAIDSVLAYPQAFAAGIVRDFLGNRLKGATERILASNYTTRMMQDVYAGTIGLSDDRLASQWDEIDAGEYKTMRDIIMMPAQAVISAGNRIDVPDEQKTFGVQVAAGLGQVVGQTASAFVDPAGQLSALIDQGIGAVSDDVQKDIEAARAAGVDVDFSSRLAAILGGGVATGVTEKLSLELIGSPLASRIANRAARFAARTLVGGLSEGSQEVAESALQTFIRRQLTNPEAKYQTGAEMFDEFTVSGAVGAIVANMLGLRRFRIGLATEKGIKSLNDEAKTSKLRGRDKQVYETLVSTQTEGTPLENAYINTEAWQTYFQSQGLDPKEQAERYGVTNYNEAVATGSDLSIPFPAYQSDFSASDHAPNFIRDTKLSENGMTVNEQEAYMQRLEERAKETESLLEQIGKESENARAVNDILSELTDEMAVQLESRYDKKTARTQATIGARAFMNPVYRDIVERAREKGQELSPDDIAGEIRDQFVRYGLTVNANATPTTVNTRKNIDPAIDAQLEKLRRNELPKERDVYGQSLMEYIRKKGGLRPDDITRDLVRNRQLPRSILNEKGMGADELASLQDVLDFGLDTETTQGDNALLDALVAEYTTGEKRYSNTQLNSELLSEVQALNDLSRDLAAAGIDLSTNTDNAAIREALSKYYEVQNGENTREEPETSETDRYEQRGFTESDTPTAEERAEANRQYDEIEKKYKGTPLWMKAPNGEPTKLSERQWVQVRTPNFKRWFGDWEKTGIRERLEGQEPIPVKSKFTEETARIKKSEAAALLKEPFSVKKNIGEVFVTRNGIRESIGHSRNAAKLDVIPHLREILEKAEYLDTLNDFDGKDIQNHYFAARIDHSGQSKLAFLRVRKMPRTENQLYVHDVFVEDEIKAGIRNNERLNNPVPALRSTDLYESILQEIYSTDNESVSKVVDSNGEPMVVYHGTTAMVGDDFAFDYKKIGTTGSAQGYGFYFTTNKSTAEGYAGQKDGSLIQAYLNMRKPMPLQQKPFGKAVMKRIIKRVVEREIAEYPDEIGSWRDSFLSNYTDTYSGSFDQALNETVNMINEGSDSALEQLSEIANTSGSKKIALEAARGATGFDGVQTKGYEDNETFYISWFPENVKSVDNIGTFTDNPNILYQFIGEKGAAALDRANEATIRLDNLSVAREMETAGKDAKAIKFATGWERGADGKWRHEIDDSHSAFGINGDIEFQKRHPEYQRMKELSEKFLFGELSSEELDELKNSESIWGREPERLRERLEDGKATLPDVLDHPELFHAYPALKDVRVWITDPSREGNLGGYSSEDNIIFVSGKAQDKHSVLMHEIQHVVQRLEGFAQGTNMETVGVHLWDLYKDFENHWKKTDAPKYQEYRNVTDQLEKELKDMFEGVEGANERYSTLHRKQQQLKEHPAVKAVNDSEKRIREKYDLGKGFPSAFVGKLSIGSNVWDGMLAHINRKDVLYTKYRRSAGETEARNVQTRLAMTPEQRRDSLASETEDVSREDQIFLYQSFASGKEGKVRGATIIHPDRTMRIELFKDANYSTFVHETAHFMLEVYGDLVSDPQASAWIKNEYATIRKYLGAEKGKPITREQHEKFARSFEAYLMEGKAPSPELQGIFSRFKNWLLNIYRSMRGLNVNLNKDIREVFDRMLASDEEIAVMRDASELQPLFATAEKMGIAQDEFDAYRKIGDSELIKAQDILRQKVMKAKLREKTKEYKEELEAEKKRVAKEYDRDPVVSAFNDLTSDNGFSLSEAQLQRIYGRAFLSRLPKRNGKRIYSKDGQVSLEDLAESLGFGSGDALIRAIAQLPSRQEYIDDRARANLLEREGDILNSDTVTDEAENALHNEYMEERLKKELAILNRLKRAGKAAKLSEQRRRIEQRKEAKRIEEDVNAQVEAMEAAARSVIAEKPVKELKPNLYLRAMQKASRLARQALDKTNPDYTAAARQKQAEIMNNLLYKEANRVQKEIDRRTLQAKAIVRKPLKDAVKTRDSLFVNRAKYIAAELGLGGNADIIMQRIRTEEQNRQDVEPFRYDLAVPLRELNTATALDVLEDVKANWDQARRGKVMLIDGKRVEIDEAAKAISDTLSDYGKTWRSSSRDDSLRNTLLKKIGNIVLDQTRMESWCDMVDGKRLGEESGPWMKYVFNPVKQAADKTRLSQAEYTERLTDIIDGFQFTRETIEAPELGYTFGKDTGYGKAELIHAILHTGNMSNFQRLLVGRGWGVILNGQVNAARWNAFMSRMIAEGRITEKDMDGVQKIWDIFEELKPQSQKAYKEVFGRYFDEIMATPFFEFGKRYAGGYVPVIYDSNESSAGEKQLDPTRDLLNEMGTAFPRLQAGWGNSRQEGNFGPLLLDLSRLRDHIGRQILFAYMAPVNRDVSRLLNHRNVRDVMRGYDPEFMGTVIKPWLSRAITQNLEASGKKPAPYDKFARELRQRAGAITMFGNVVNAIEQVFDMTAAYSKVKGRYLTDAFRTMVSDRSGTVQAVMEASVYMRGRMSAEIMAANGRLEQAFRLGRLKKLDRWLIDHAYFLQASVDNFCGPLTWMAAYNQATEAGLSHSEAVLQADSVVRQVFGANAAEDVSNFEAGGPLKRLFSQFTGYFVQRANLIAGEYSKIQRSDIANKKAAAAMLLLQTVLLPAWIGAALRKFAAGSDDDDNTFASWLMDVFGWGTFNYGLSMGGYAGQIANAAIDQYRGKSFASGRVFYPPTIKMIEDAFKFRKWENSSGDFDVSKFVQDMAEIERVVPGLPIIPARPVATARYIYDVATDEVEPTGTYDFVRGAVTGRASPDSK